MKDSKDYNQYYTGNRKEERIIKDKGYFDNEADKYLVKYSDLKNEVDNRRKRTLMIMFVGVVMLFILIFGWKYLSAKFIIITIILIIGIAFATRHSYNKQIELDKIYLDALKKNEY